ncbi:hypothetical protein MMC30_002120 [Trapelia coarctata]|nr:hypothetical protein [Trapelia coarctata]
MARFKWRLCQLLRICRSTGAPAGTATDVTKTLPPATSALYISEIVGMIIAALSQDKSTLAVCAHKFGNGGLKWTSQLPSSQALGQSLNHTAVSGMRTKSTLLGTSNS